MFPVDPKRNSDVTGPHPGARTDPHYPETGSYWRRPMRGRLDSNRPTTDSHAAGTPPALVRGPYDRALPTPGFAASLRKPSKPRAASCYRGTISRLGCATPTDQVYRGITSALALYQRQGRLLSFSYYLTIKFMLMLCGFMLPPLTLFKHTEALAYAPNSVLPYKAYSYLALPPH